MSLTVEDGTGVQSAESYATVALADAYWAARTHSPHYTTWSAVSNTTAKKEGALREATAYIDATWGAYYRGQRRGYVQGLLWPRTDAKDEADYPLPDLPAQLQAAAVELAARAVSAALATDDTQTDIKAETKKVGPIEKTVQYESGGLHRPSYGFVADLLAPILNGAQPNAPQGGWAWA